MCTCTGAQSTHAALPARASWAQFTTSPTPSATSLRLDWLPRRPAQVVSRSRAAQYGDGPACAGAGACGRAGHKTACHLEPVSCSVKRRTDRQLVGLPDQSLCTAEVISKGYVARSQLPPDRSALWLCSRPWPTTSSASAAPAALAALQIRRQRRHSRGGGGK